YALRGTVFRHRAERLFGSRFLTVGGGASADSEAGEPPWLSFIFGSFEATALRPDTPPDTHARVLANPVLARLSEFLSAITTDGACLLGAHHPGATYHLKGLRHFQVSAERIRHLHLAWRLAFRLEQSG